MAQHVPEQVPDDYRDRLYRAYVSTCYAAGGPDLTDRSSRNPMQYDSSARRKPVFHHQVIHALPRDRDAAILDVGCGHGGLVAALQSLGYRRTRGIDRSPEQVMIAKSLGISRIEQADAGEYLRTHTEQWDAILAFDLLEHLSKSEVLPFLELVRSALKVNGRIIVQTVNGSSPFFGNYFHGDFTHETVFTGLSMHQILLASGFDDISVVEADPIPHGLLSTMRKILWLGIRSVLVGYLAVESGVYRGHILTQSLLATARRPA
jgi:SAM-dependent methyltransferase